MKRSTEIAACCALVIASLLGTLGVMELGYRLWRGPHWLVHWPNTFSGERRRMAADESICSYVHHSTLGWAPNPSFTSTHFTVGPDGTRRMPALAPGASATPVILATGDSFTEGLEVDDDQSWPAYLQERLRVRTLNAGVSGFGLDQTLLRTEEMVATYPVAVAVVSFIVDDVRRTEQSRAWTADKPWFELKGEELLLRNSPVPPPRHAACELPLWQSLIGWSTIVDRVARGLEWIDRRALPDGMGRNLACPIMQRLARLGVPVLVVAQYGLETWHHGDADRDEQHGEALRVLECAAKAGLSILDSFGTVQQAVKVMGLPMLYREGGHHSPVGNELIAELIAGRLPPIE